MAFDYGMKKGKKDMPMRGKAMSMPMKEIPKDMPMKGKMCPTCGKPM